MCANLTRLQDVIEVFVSEAKTSAALTHPNIVQFVGICVRPPSIAMVHSDIHIQYMDLC